MDPPDLIVAALAGASDHQLIRVLAVLARMAERADRTAVARAVLDDNLPDLVRRATGDNPELRHGLTTAVQLLRPTAGAVAAIDELPPINVRTARLVGQVLLTAGPTLEAAAKSSDDVLANLARLHNDLNVAFGYWRELDWAVKAGRRSVELHRRLVVRDGRHRHAGLASALSNWAVALSDVFDHEAALAAGEEAVELYRELPDADSPRRLAGLANVLTNHSTRQGWAGQTATALSSAQEAVNVWRAAVTAGDPSATVGLARSLSNLSVRLGKVGRAEEALAMIREAVQIRRELAVVDPQEHLSDLTLSLSNMSVRLDAAGRGRDALDALQEAIRIRRDLAAADPDKHLAELATSLKNLSVRLSVQGHPVGEQLAASSEAVGIYRRLTGSHPDTRAALASALHTQSIDLAAAGDISMAVHAAEEAVTIRRPFAANGSDEERGHLAMSLYNLSLREAAVGHAIPALEAATEAVEIYRELTATRPDLHRADLADALGNLSSGLDAVGRPADARAATQEAVNLRRVLAQSDADRYLPSLATSLNNLSIDLTRAGLLADAIAASEEAIATRRALAAGRPDRYQRELALNLNNYGVALSDLGRNEEASAALEEAVTIYKDRYGSGRRDDLLDLMRAVGNLAEQPQAHNRGHEIEPLLTEMLAAHRDSDWSTGVILRGRGTWHTLRGDLTAAVDDLCSALVLLRDDQVHHAATRIRLRRARQIDPAAFDLAWARRGGLPVWLRHVEVGAPVADAVRAWIDTVDLDESAAMLSARAAMLLSDEAEARMHHLVDANPDHQGLRLDMDIIRVARVRGVAAAYAQHQDRLWRDGIADALASWIAAGDRQDLRAVFAAEGVLLLDDAAAAQMEGQLAADPGDPSLIERAGLLALCRLDGVDAAFELVENPELQSAARRLRDVTVDPRELARARLRTGSAPDDPEAAFEHAVLAAFTAHDDEAERAILRCAGLVTSWERREMARTLTGLMRDIPEATAALSRLLRLTADVDRARRRVPEATSSP